ncbi:MAG: GTP 3',8-cyclase MoaA [Ruminococcus sp.]|nr:GTP 3',8-cyclase MoaA [Ruminococcus sp.]MBQ6153738.1 GTP 3',8-cyclase MoaA [Ruminococcus sp.]
MKDSYGRKIQYLRLSVTDLCNYRCIYCMPESGVIKKRHGDMLSIEEMTGIVRAAHRLGVNKVRLTGGEPLVRRGIVSLCRNIKAIDNAIELGITTNGSLLAPMAGILKEARVDRLNISLDSLNPDTFSKITRGGDVRDVADGIKAAQNAGFDNIKINCVLLNGINDKELFEMISLTREHPVHVRFIELMPLGVAKEWDSSRFMTTASAEKYLQNAELLRIDGVARVYGFPGYKGTIGLICPMSHSFCPSCNKIRVTADGKLKPCLHSDQEIDLKGLSGEKLEQAIRDGIMQKPESHRFGLAGSATGRNMNEIGG